MSIEPSSFDVSSATDGCTPWPVDGRAAAADPSHQDEEDSEDSDNPAAGTWYYRGELVAQNNKACVKHLAHGASSSVDQESQKNTGAMWDHNLPKSAGHIALHGSRLLHWSGRAVENNQGDPMEDLNVNLALWEMFMNTTPSSGSSSRKRL